MDQERQASERYAMFTQEFGDVFEKLHNENEAKETAQDTINESSTKV